MISNFHYICLIAQYKSKICVILLHERMNAMEIKQSFVIIFCLLVTPISKPSLCTSVYIVFVFVFAYRLLCFFSRFVDGCRDWHAEVPKIMAEIVTLHKRSLNLNR